MSKHIKILIWIAIILLVWFGTGCKMTSKLQKQKATYEQSEAKLRDSLTHVITERDSVHEKEVQKIKAAGIQFRDKPVPVPIYYPDTVTRATLLNVIADLNGQLAAKDNRIEILADGTIRGWGDIANAYSTVEQKDKEIFRLRKYSDSLAHVIASDTASVKVEETQSSQSSKTSTFDWLRWILFIAGIGVGLMIRHNWKRILSIFKIFKMKSMILFLLTCMLFLTGCADFHDEPGKSVWSEGMWFIPWGLVALTLLSIVKGIMAYRSNSKQQNMKGTVYYDKPVKWYKIKQFWYAAALIIILILIIIWQVGER